MTVAKNSVENYEADILNAFNCSKGCDIGSYIQEMKYNTDILLTFYWHGKNLLLT